MDDWPEIQSPDQASGLEFVQSNSDLECLRNVLFSCNDVSLSPGELGTDVTNVLWRMQICKANSSSSSNSSNSSSNSILRRELGEAFRVALELGLGWQTQKLKRGIVPNRPQDFLTPTNFCSYTFLNVPICFLDIRLYIYI